MHFLKRQVVNLVVACERPKLASYLQKNFAAAQAHALARALDSVVGTLYAQRLGLKTPMSATEFRRTVPVTSYDSIENYITAEYEGKTKSLLARPPIFFATSSGTTGPRKLLPVTEIALQQYRQSWFLWSLACARDYPQLRHLRILNFAGNSREAVGTAGTPAGAMTGLLAQINYPRFRDLYVLRPDVTRIANDDLRLYCTARAALTVRDIGTLVSANPSTLLRFFNFIRDERAKLVRDVFDGRSDALAPKSLGLARPNRKVARALEVMPDFNPTTLWPTLTLCGVWLGGTLSTYLPELRKRLPGVAFRDHGLSASEGRFTLPMESETPIGMVEQDAAFYEFRSLKNPEQILCAPELSPGDDYELIVSTASGLLRYAMADVVKCTAVKNSVPMLQFLNKGSQFANITGEKLSSFQVAKALIQTQEETGIDLTQAFLRPMIEQRCYELCGPFTSMEAAEQLGPALDRALKAANYEYAAKRSSDRLGPLLVRLVSHDAMRRFREAEFTRCSIEQFKPAVLVLAQGELFG